jgi:cytochrome P450
VRDGLVSEAEWAEFQSLGSRRHIFRIFGPERESQHAWWIRVLSPRALGPWRDELMRPLAEEQLDRVAERGAADLWVDYALPVPPRVTAVILGAPADDAWIAAMRTATEARAALRQHRGGGNPAPDVVDAARRATTAMHDLLAPVVEARRAAPRSDLISLLWLDGDALFGPGFEALDVVGAASMVWEAGTWTISLATANALHLLAVEPELQHGLRDADGKVVARFVEEVFRLHGPVHARTERIAMEPVRLGGVDITPGDRVIAVTGAANRDPARYPDAARLHLDRRAPHDHFGFWKGPMICLGQGLSRMQAFRCR